MGSYNAFFTFVISLIKNLLAYLLTDVECANHTIDSSYVSKNSWPKDVSHVTAIDCRYFSSGHRLNFQLLMLTVTVLCPVPDYTAWRHGARVEPVTS